MRITALRAAGLALASLTALLAPAVALPSASAYTCTPKTWLERPFLDAEGHTQFVAHYNTCGESMVLSIKSRLYGEGRYEWWARNGVQGKGTATFAAWGCGGGEPIKGQYLTTLKIGPTLYAKSEPRTWTQPDPPCA